MTIIATAPVPASLRLDSAATLTRILPASACPAWCADGPHEPYNDGGEITVLHQGEGVGHQIHGDPFGTLAEVDITPAWLEGSDEPAHVYVNLSEKSQTLAEMMLTAEQAERIAADLIAAARQIRTGSAR